MPSSTTTNAQRNPNGLAIALTTRTNRLPANPTSSLPASDTNFNSNDTLRSPRKILNGVALQGAGVCKSGIRGYRFAQPPANGCDPSRGRCAVAGKRVTVVHEIRRDPLAAGADRLQVPLVRVAHFLQLFLHDR